jgi:hypothetical protein
MKNKKKVKYLDLKIGDPKKGRNFLFFSFCKKFSGSSTAITFCLLIILFHFSGYFSFHPCLADLKDLHFKVTNSLFYQR